MPNDDGPGLEAGFSDALAALSNPVRLALLRQLRTPKTLHEIGVGQNGPWGLARPPRPLARQTVKEHLERLIPTGIVLARPAQRDYGETVEYVLNHQRLFGLGESLRELAKIRPTPEPSALTVQQGPPPVPFKIAGPCLVLAKGLEEGRTFPLVPPASGSRSWIIGRRRGAAVSLDYDPFVSTENAAIEWDGRAHVLRDLPESRNGTLLNFQALPKGQGRPLAHGDLVGVGRSVLLFRA